MLRKTLLACAVALPLGAITAAPVLADTDVDIHFGVPFYSYQVAPRYRYYDDYGWYDAERYSDFRADEYGDDDDDDYVVVRHGRLSCGEARRIVRANGFRRVVPEDCDGATYAFTGMRHGRVFTIYVNSRNGRMWGA